MLAWIIFSLAACMNLDYGFNTQKIRKEKQINLSRLPNIRIDVRTAKQKALSLCMKYVIRKVNRKNNGYTIIPLTPLLHDIKIIGLYISLK